MTQITYLDGERNPAPNKAGCTILRRSYDAEGKLYEDRYYDGEGRPTATSKGQYGVRYVNGMALQINRFGWIKLSADNLINGFPHMVVIHALQKEVLSVIAAQYSVSWGAVERNLRIISQKAWDTDSGYVEKHAGETNCASKNASKWGQFQRTLSFGVTPHCAA